MTEQLVYIGLRCIGRVSDTGKQYEAWAEPGSEALGRFNSHAAAARAIYEHDAAQRAEGAS